jgi:curved DNA-binding protein CbpA
MSYGHLQEYRTLARRLHPDKGGSSEAFAALQAAFDVLSNPQTRKVYDALAADVRFRPGAAAPYSQVRWFK